MLIFNLSKSWDLILNESGWFKSFALFWKRKTQFGYSECFCWGHEGDETYWTMRYRARLIFSRYSPELPLCHLEHGLGIHAFRSTSSLRFLRPDRNFINYLITVLWSIALSPFAQQIFFVVSTAIGPTSNLLNINFRIRLRCMFSMRLSSHIRYYQPQRVPNTACTDMSFDIHAANSQVPKYCKTFDSL